MERGDQRPQLLPPSTADSLSNHNTRGGGRAVGHYGENLVHLHGDGVGRRHIPAQMAQNAGLHHLRHAPQRLIHQHRRGNPVIIPDVAPIDEEQLPRRKAQLSLPAFQKPDNNHQLHAPGDQRGHRCPPDPKLRTAPAPIDQQVIERHIDPQRGEGNHIANPDNAHRPQGGHQNISNRKNDICKADDLKILNALGNHRFLVGQQPQQRLRRDQHQGKQRRRQPSAEAERHADDVGNRFQPASPPVLGAQHHGSLSRAGHQHLEQKLHLITEAHTAHGVLAVPSQHHRVHQVHPKGQQVLKGQGHRQGKKSTVKTPFSNHGRSPPPPCRQR